MRPLVKRAPDGRPYAVPSTPRRPVPPLTAQLDDGTPDPAEPTPPQGEPPHKPQPGHGMGRAKLTDDEVRAIRAEYAEGKWTRQDLAYIYGVGVAAIGNVLSGRSYTHVTTEPTSTEQDS